MALEAGWQSKIGEAKVYDTERIEDAKKRARGDLHLCNWMHNGYAYHIDTLAEPVSAGYIARHDTKTLSVEAFISAFEKPNVPVIITSCASEWSASRAWQPTELYKNYRHRRFKCGEDDDGYPVKIKLKYFLRYMARQRDDSPLYIFDSMFEDDKRSCKILHDYAVPAYFSEGAGGWRGVARRSLHSRRKNKGPCVRRSLHALVRAKLSRPRSKHSSFAELSRLPHVADLFRYVGEHRRPPYRWFLIGPQRSGTGVHVDPLSTSAWNTLIFGRKR